MAKIYGVELKAIKYFEGREGIGFNSNIYLNNKKIGTFSDYAFGAMEEYSFDSKTTKEQIQELRELAEQYFNDFPMYLFYPQDKVVEFLSEILKLKEIEDSFKKERKKNSECIIITGSFEKRTELQLSDVADEVIVSINHYDKVKVSNYIKKQGFIEYNIYKSLEDFIINKTA